VSAEPKRPRTIHVLHARVRIVFRTFEIEVHLVVAHGGCCGLLSVRLG
jgi:hypothetical protein